MTKRLLKKACLNFSSLQNEMWPGQAIHLHLPTKVESTHARTVRRLDSSVSDYISVFSMLQWRDDRRARRTAIAAQRHSQKYGIRNSSALIIVVPTSDSVKVTVHSAMIVVFYFSEFLFETVASAVRYSLDRWALW